MAIEREYGVTTDVIFPLIAEGGNPFAYSGSVVTAASGDLSLSKDEGAMTNIAVQSMGHIGRGFYRVKLSGTEMQFARGSLAIIDQTASQTWEDQAVLIETYGDPSAQHAFNRNDAIPPADVQHWHGVSPEPLLNSLVQIDLARWHGVSAEPLNAGHVLSRPQSMADVVPVLANVQQWQGVSPEPLSSLLVQSSVAAMQAGVVTAAAVATDAIDDDAIAADAYAAIADANWDEDIVAAHSTADTAGLILAQITKVALGTFSAEVLDGSVIGQMVDDGTAVFDRTQDSLQAIRDNQAGADVNSIAAAVWDAPVVASFDIADSAGALLENLQLPVDANVVRWHGVSPEPLSSLRVQTAPQDMTAVEPVLGNLQQWLGVSPEPLNSGHVLSRPQSMADVEPVLSNLQQWQGASPEPLTSLLVQASVPSLEPAPLAFAVWEEVLTGATHNIANSAGRRLRALQEFQGYDNGAVWIDTVNGTDGTTSFENGTVDNPVKTIADANTIAGNVGLSRFEVAPGSSFTFAASQQNQVFNGSGWTLALGGRDIASTTIIGATVSGTGTGSAALFVECLVGTVTLADATLRRCGLTATITASATGDYYLDACYSGIAGSDTVIFDIGSGVANTNVNFRHWSGGIEIQNVGQAGTDAVSIEGFGQIVVNANCTGGTIVIRGTFRLTDNGTSTITQDARFAVTQILADSTAFSGANVDATISSRAVPGDAMDVQTWHGVSPEPLNAGHVLTRPQSMADVEPVASDLRQWLGVSPEPLTSLLVQTAPQSMAAVEPVLGNLQQWLGASPEPLSSRLVQTEVISMLTAVPSLTAAVFADINAEVVDVMTVDTLAELAGDPGTNPTFAEGFMMLYHPARNAYTANASVEEIRNNAGAVIITRPIADDGSTFTKSQVT